MFKKKIWLILGIVASIGLSWTIQSYRIIDYRLPDSLNRFASSIDQSYFDQPIDSLFLKYFTIEKIEEKYYIDVIKERYFYNVQGFNPVEITLPIDWESSPVINHSSWQLRWHSLELIHSLLAFYTETHDIKYLQWAKDTVINWIQINRSPSFFSSLFMGEKVWNDHAVARRSEMLTELYFHLILNREQSKVSEYELRLILAEIIRHGEFLCEQAMESWISNHGLITDYALLKLAFIFKNHPFSKKWKQTANKRILKRLPFLIAEDGTPLEGASNYWIFIFTKFDEIGQMYKIAGKPIPQELESRLSKSRNLLSKFMREDNAYFIFGDSFPKKFSQEWRREYLSVNDMPLDSSTDIDILVLQAGAFLINWRNNQLFFSFLDTPPHIHQHADQLAIYLFTNNQSWFQAPGTYAYERFGIRKWIKTSAAQSTVYLQEHQDIAEILDPIVYHRENGFFAAKVSKRSKGIKVQREIILNFPKRELFIQDKLLGSSKDVEKSSMYSQFVLPPETIFENTIGFATLHKDESLLFARAVQNQWQIDSTFISPFPRKLISTQKAYLIANANKDNSSLNRIIFSWHAQLDSFSQPDYYDSLSRTFVYKDTLILYDRYSIYQNLIKDLPQGMMSIYRTQKVTQIVLILTFMSLLLFFNTIYRYRVVFITLLLCAYLGLLLFAYSLYVYVL